MQCYRIRQEQRNQLPDKMEGMPDKLLGYHKKAYFESATVLLWEECYILQYLIHVWNTLLTVTAELQKK